MKQTLSSRYYWLAAIVIVILLYLLAPVLTPFLAAALLAYLADPLVEKITRWHVPRLISVIIVFLMLCALFVLLILLLIPLIQKQISLLAVAIPNIIAWIQVSILPWLKSSLGIQEQINVDTLKETLVQHWSSAGGALSWVATTLFQSGRALVLLIMNLLLIPVVTFYLLRDWRIVLNSARKLIPRHIEPTVVKLVKECDNVLSAFLRGQLLVMISLGIVYSIGLMAIGLQIGLIIGLISGLMCIIPYLGFIVGISAASVAAYAQFGTTTSILLVFVVYGVGQVLETAILTPKFVGDRIGLHPVAVIFALLAGGALFGFFGVLLALPVAAVIMVWLRFLNQQYYHSRLYQS